MDMATIAAMEIAVIFGFEFMILAGPFCISLFSQCLYKQGIFQCCRAIVEGRIIDASIKLNIFLGTLFQGVLAVSATPIVEARNIDASIKLNIFLKEFLPGIVRGAGPLAA